MQINSLKLPVSFVEIIHKGILRREIGCWNLLQEIDSYGNRFESELCEIYATEEKIIQETFNLPKHFAPDGFYGEVSDSQNEVGFIPDIIDFSKIVCFGIAGDDAPFCFDYRDNLASPSIIWWDDVYWRRISPNFESFIKLFDLGKYSRLKN